MAPEMIQDSTTVSPLSDTYALGATLYYALTGTDLFPGRDAMAVMVAHMTEEPPHITSHGPPVPEELAQLVHDCLSKERSKRPQSARELAERLAASLSTKWTLAQAEQWWQASASTQVMWRRSRVGSGSEPQMKSAVDPAAQTVVIEHPPGDSQ